MMVVELIELSAGVPRAGLVEGGPRIGVQVRTRGQAEPAEQPLLGVAEVGVGQVERGRDRQVLRPHHGQPVAGRRETGGDLRAGPGRMMPQLLGEHPDGQRQVAAQPGDLPGRACSGAEVGTAGQPGQQRHRLGFRQRAEADHRRVLQRGQPPAAGDQDQAARGARQQRPDLLVPGRVVQQKEDPLARDVITPAAGPGRHPGRDLLHGDTGRQEQARQRVGRADRPLAGGVGVQREEELAVREVPGQPVRGVHGQGRLADAGHPVDDADPQRPAVRRHACHARHARHARQSAQEPRQFRLAPGEAADIARQAPGSSGRGPSVRPVGPGRQNLRGRRAAPCRRDEQNPHLTGQAERVSQQHRGVLARGAVDAPLQVADRPRAQARGLGQLLLRQPGLGPELPQQPGEAQRGSAAASAVPHQTAEAMQCTSPSLRAHSGRLPALSGRGPARR